MKYVTPEIEVLEIDIIDVIQASTGNGQENPKNPPQGGENDLPIN